MCEFWTLRPQKSCVSEGHLQSQNILSHAYSPSCGISCHLYAEATVSLHLYAEATVSLHLYAEATVSLCSIEAAPDCTGIMLTHYTYQCHCKIYFHCIACGIFTPRGNLIHACSCFKVGSYLHQSFASTWQNSFVYILLVPKTIYCLLFTERKKRQLEGELWEFGTFNLLQIPPNCNKSVVT